MYYKPTSPKIFIELPLDKLLASPHQIDFYGAVDGTTDGGIEWETVSKITTLFNTYLFSLSPKTKLNLEDMHLRLWVASHATTTVHYTAATGTTHEMDPNYGSFLSYHLSYNGNYITLGNRDKEPISRYVTTLVRLGGKVMAKTERISCLRN